MKLRLSILEFYLGNAKVNAARNPQSAIVASGPPNGILGPAARETACLPSFVTADTIGFRYALVVLFSQIPLNSKIVFRWLFKLIAAVSVLNRILHSVMPSCRGARDYFRQVQAHCRANAFRSSKKQEGPSLRCKASIRLFAANSS